MANFLNPNFETDLAGWGAGKNPNEIGGALACGWFDANQIVGLNDGDEILSVLDSSGNNNTLSKVTAVGPTYKTGIRNGLPVMRFNNAHQLGRDGLANYPAGLDPFDLFMVASPTVADDTDTLFQWGISQDNNVVFCIYRAASDKWYYEWWGGPSDTPFGTLPVGNFGLLHGDRIGDTFTARLNGTVGGSFVKVGLSPWNWTTVGNLRGYALYFTGDVSEYIITKGLTSQQKADISSYLAMKWNLPLLGLGTAFSRDTGIKYAGAASMKAVSVNTTQVFETFNPETTNSIKLTGYAYTDGSPVTNADVELLYNDAAVPTTYTSVGSGWYKMEANVTGINSPIKSGAEVKAGKTVYLDGFDLAGAIIVGPFPTYLP